MDSYEIIITPDAEAYNSCMYHRIAPIHTVFDSERYISRSRMERWEMLKKGMAALRGRNLLTLQLYTTGAYGEPGFSPPPLLQTYSP